MTYPTSKVLAGVVHFRTLVTQTLTLTLTLTLNLTLTLILTLTNPNLNSNSTLTLTLTLRRVIKVRKWTRAGVDCNTTNVK